MERPHLKLPPWAKSLSARLLVLTVGFVMLAEIFVFAPSVARYRVDWLKAHLDSGYLAALALEATPDQMIPDDLEKELLSNAGIEAVILRRDDRKLLLQRDDMPAKVDHDVDLTTFSILMALYEGLSTLTQPHDRMLRVVGMPSMAPDFEIEILVHEHGLAEDMRNFGWRVMGLSLVISFFTAGLVYFALNRLLVRPMRTLTSDMIRFRENPQDQGSVIVPDDRDDEIGIARHELANMQHDLQAMLNQRRRLAALGTAATKISHDLRNALATSMLMTEKLAQSEDQEVRAVVPRLLSSMERAVYISEQTLSFAREAPPTLDIARFTLIELIEEVRDQVLLQNGGESLLAPESLDTAKEPCKAKIHIELPPELMIEADYDQLFRAFSNLIRNPLDAGATEVTVKLAPANDQNKEDAFAEILIMDNGPGLPEKAIKNLFVPFAGTGRKGGTGLGLAIARELILAHEGDLRLSATGPDGATFCVQLRVIV
ncbi:MULTISPECIES: HAMP domain-containing sensor histidine kinase [Thalassospira]|uniref:sensor histidine kinase n=1 Tax=Thalassospira TaxID=168934 RepID=UPI0008DCB515|nr:MULTISPECIES: HAMP domain-containing sensor histidine kinase [Thalassospira]MAB35104.1 sensor histidine kinase [Thalassospira sp.]MDM7977510.1 HAMP domain-containing sensor histidine kinase [Thalassospira xiamenensis]OHZ04716.1 histidine kinase [Thalassospira sp. MIT1004]HBS25209.1 sensor histidine kinase [Thalassospira sp.]